VLPDVQNAGIDSEAVRAETVAQPLPDVLEVATERKTGVDIASIAEKESGVVIAVEDEAALVHDEQILGIIELAVAVLIDLLEAARVRNVVHAQPHQRDGERLTGPARGAHGHDVGEEVVLHDGAELLRVHGGDLP